MNKFCARCPKCGGTTSKNYLRQHGSCKPCATGTEKAERSDDSAGTCYGRNNAFILEHGWGAYAREEGHYDFGGDR